MKTGRGVRISGGGIVPEFSVAVTTVDTWFGGVIPRVFCARLQD